MDIGKPQKTITITPLELPIPHRAPQEQPQQPVQAPERERVAVPA